MVTINIYQAQGNDSAQTPGSSSPNASSQTDIATQSSDVPSPTMQPGGINSEAQTSDVPSPTMQPGETDSDAQTGSAPIPTLQPDANTGEFQAIEQSNQPGESGPEPSAIPPGANADETAGKKGNKKK